MQASPGKILLLNDCVWFLDDMHFEGMSKSAMWNELYSSLSYFTVSIHLAIIAATVIIAVISRLCYIILAAVTVFVWAFWLPCGQGEALTLMVCSVCKTLREGFVWKLIVCSWRRPLRAGTTSRWPAFPMFSIPMSFKKQRLDRSLHSDGSPRINHNSSCQF